MTTEHEYALYDKLFKSYERKRFNKEERRTIIQKSIKCAEDVFLSMKDNEADIVWDMFEKYGVQVNVITDLTSSRLLASYNHIYNQLDIYLKVIENYLSTGKVEINLGEMLNLVLAHELYHVVEMNEPDIYTYSFIYERKFLWKKVRYRIEAASEVGAHHFSKLMNRLEYSPIILNNL